MKVVLFMKKLLLDIILIIIIPITLTSCTNNHSDEIALSFIPEESNFVDYEINGDRIKFRYSICFYNHTSEPTEIGVSAKFIKKELDGWLRYEKFFIGTDDNDGLLKYGLIKPKEKTNIIYTFEGNYLGGTVNDTLSFPEELMTIEK